MWQNTEKVITEQRKLHLENEATSDFQQHTELS